MHRNLLSFAGKSLRDEAFRSVDQIPVTVLPVSLGNCLQNVFLLLVAVSASRHIVSVLNLGRNWNC